MLTLLFFLVNTDLILVGGAVNFSFIIKFLFARDSYGVDMKTIPTHLVLIGNVKIKNKIKFFPQMK